jgi:hypothetical protein
MEQHDGSDATLGANGVAVPMTGEKKKTLTPPIFLYDEIEKI